MSNYKKQRNDKIKGMTEDLLNQIKKTLDEDETKKIEEQITKIKNNDDLHNIIGIKEIIKLDYSNIFTNMEKFLKLDDKQKGGRVRQPDRISVFRSQNNYNSDVEDEYIDIGEIIENNNGADLRTQVVEEQQLIEQEIRERNLAYRQEIERYQAYRQEILRAEQLLQGSEMRTRQEILQLIISQQQQQLQRNEMATIQEILQIIRSQQQEEQQEQQETEKMANENQNVQSIEKQDEHIQNIMSSLMNSIEDNYQQETKKMEEELLVLNEELRVIMTMAREEGEEGEEGIKYPLGSYSILDIFKICYGCLFIIQRLISFDPILAVIFAPILLFIIIIRKIILYLLLEQQRGGKKTNKRKTKKRKSNRNKLKKNIKKKTKKVKKVKKTKSKK